MKTVKIRTKIGRTGLSVSFDQTMSLNELFIQIGDILSTTQYSDYNIKLECNNNVQWSIEKDFKLTIIDDYHQLAINNVQWSIEKDFKLKIIDDYHELTIINLTGNDNLGSIMLDENMSLFISINNIFIEMGPPK